MEVVRREERKEGRKKEAGKDRVEEKEKKGKENMGSLAVSHFSLAKSLPVQDVNKLICQCEVFTHFAPLWAV